MTDTPFIDHRLIKRTRELTPITDSLELIMGMSPIALLHALPDEGQDPDDISDDVMGYLVTADDKLVARLIHPDEADALGKDTVSFEEMIAFVDRASRLGELERAATDAQAVYVRIRRLFRLAADHVINGTPLTAKERRAIGALHHELNETDAENAEDERKAREANDKFMRERLLGIQVTAAKFGLQAKRAA